MDYIPVIQLKQETIQEAPIRNTTLSSNTDVAHFAQSFIGDSDRETVIVIGVSTKSKINFVSTIALGSLNSTIVTPREIFKCALLTNTARIILAHNHPSFDVSPSEKDILFTERLLEAGKYIGIELLDHVIVSPTEYYSLRQEGIY